MKLVLHFEGTEEELIQIAEYNSEGLDSHDLGDAMGYFMTATMMEDLEMAFSMPGCDSLVQCMIEIDSFKWVIEK